MIELTRVIKTPPKVSNIFTLTLGAFHNYMNFIGIILWRDNCF